MDIVSTFKGSTDKIGAVDRIIRETGMSAVDVFVQLIECNCIDGRAFRQGRFKDDWFAAKKAVKKDSIQRAESASRSLTEEIKNLRAENEKLQKQLENAKNSHDVANDADLEAYHKTIDTQKEEIDKLNAAIEQMKDEYKASDEMNAKLQNEKSDTDALIEDLNSVVKLREDEIKELNKKIGIYENDLWDVLDKTNLIFGNTFCERSECNIVSEAEMLYDSVKALDESAALRGLKIEELENRIKHLKVSDFNSAADSMINESKLKTANDEITRLKEYIRGLEEQLEDETPSNGETLKRQLDETTQNYNEAMLMNKKLEEQIKYYEDEKDGDGIVIEQLKATNDLLHSKLTACEKYILDLLVYEV